MDGRTDNGRMADACVTTVALLTMSSRAKNSSKKAARIRQVLEFPEEPVLTKR